MTKSFISDYDVLVYGATFAGLGVALTCREKTLVVERTKLVGSEYINSFNIGNNLKNEPLSPIGKKLKEELLQRNVLSEGGDVHLPGIAPVLYRMVQTEQINLLLMTELVDIRPSADGFDVTLFNRSGLQHYKVKHIIDTTTLCRFYPSDIIYKRLNAMLHSPREDAAWPVSDQPGVTFVKGLFPAEVILRFELSPEDNWVSARHKLYRYWSKEHEKFEPWVIAAVADEFETRSPQGPHWIKENWSWLPSNAYSNCLNAMDAGWNYATDQLRAYSLST
jgi:hypothetical protein